jgi:competence protein ComEC
MRVAFLAAFVGLGAFAVAQVESAPVRTGPVVTAAHAMRSVHIEAVVTNDPVAVRPKPTTPSWAEPHDIVDLRVESIAVDARTSRTRVPIVALTPTSWSGLVPGTRVSADARLRPDDPHRGSAAFAIVDGGPTFVRQAPLIQRVAARIRSRLQAAVSGLPADQRGLVPGLVIGDTSQIPAQLSADAATTGLTHLVAVSGENVAIVLGALIWLLGRVGVRGRLVVVFALVGLVAFVVLVRPQPSVLRAAAMGTCVLLGVRGRAAPALCAAIVGLMLIDPWLALSIGFALSTAATAGLVFVAPRWRRLSTQRPRRRLLAAATTALIAAAVAQMMCGPLIAAISGTFSLSAVPANIMAAPAVPLATLAGLVAALIAPWSVTVARIPAWIAGLGAGWIAAVAHGWASVTWLVIRLPPGRAGFLWALALTGLLMAAFAVFRVVTAGTRTRAGRSDRADVTS